MCFFRPIPPIFPMLYDLDQALQHLTEDSEAETIPWSFNADAAEFVPQGNIFGEQAPRGTTRVWADMTDSDGEDVPEQETPAQRNARRLEELRTLSLQDIVVLDCFTYQAKPTATPWSARFTASPPPTSAWTPPASSSLTRDSH